MLVRLRNRWRLPRRLLRGPALVGLLVLAAAGRPGFEPAAMAQKPDPTIVGQWSAVQSWPIVAVHATLLPCGKVFAYPYNDTVRCWNPATKAFTTPASVGYNPFCNGHTLLPNGKVFLSGGHIENGVGLPNASSYDPVANTWTHYPDMNAGRWYPTNTTLGTGDILVLSGNIDNKVGANPLPQVWRVREGTWQSLIDAELILPLYPWMHLAPDGSVFCSGPGRTTRSLSTSENGSWTTVANRQFGSRSYGSAVLYDDGKVLVVGGGDPPTATAEVIDLTADTPAWSYTAPMTIPRRQLNATLLPDGKVLVTGGSSAPGFNEPRGAVLYAEQWDPATETWTELAEYTRYRGYHSTALLLPDGRVLSAGGDGQPNAEIFSPPYLFQGKRPTITAAPATVGYGQTFRVQTPNADAIARVTWLRLGSVTHAFNMNQRINELAFEPAKDWLNVTAPSSRNLAPPGHYMLFLLNGAGVPSVARVIRLC